MNEHDSVGLVANTASISHYGQYVDFYDVFDGCYGITVACSNTGAYLTLDNGESAFAYKFSNLLPGTKVLCTVLKQATKARLKIVSIDSVVYPRIA